MLPDGSRILVDASSMARQGDDVLILGSTFHVLGSSAQTNAGAVGLVRSGDGHISLVPSPLPTDTVRELQATAAKDGGWHVLFVTGRSGTKWHAFAYDTADIWYSHYDGHAWVGTQRITRAYAAILSPRHASNLVETGQGLAFAFPLDRSSERRSNAKGNQGVVMLLRRHDGWTEDTLHTWEAPGSIRLSVPDGMLRAIISQSYFANRRPHGPALFIADYDSTWKAPRMIYDPAPETVWRLLTPNGGEGSRVVSWHAAHPGFDVDEQRLEWGVIRDDGTIRSSVVGTVVVLGRSAMVELDNYATAWLVRDGDSRERLRVYVATDGDARVVGVVDTPLMNFVTHAVPLKDGRILALTGGPDPAPDAEPPFVSYLNEITVRCARAR